MSIIFSELSISERISLFVNEIGVSMRSFEDKIGASNGVVRKAIANKTDIQSKWLPVIAEKYPQLNLVWLITGKGDMLNKIEEASEKKITTVTEINPDDPAQKMLLEMIDKKDLRIEELKEEIGKLKEQQAAFLEKNIYSDSASTIRIVAEENINTEKEK